MLNFELEFEKATTRVVAHDLQCNVKIGFVVREDDHVPKGMMFLTKGLSM